MGAKEPITPFITKLPPLVAQRGVSCVLVIGGSGQYLTWQVGRAGQGGAGCALAPCARVLSPSYPRGNAWPWPPPPPPPPLHPAPCCTPSDTVICMDSYNPLDVTERALAISRRHAGPGERLPRAKAYGDVTPRTLVSGAHLLGGAGGRAGRRGCRRLRTQPCAAGARYACRGQEASVRCCMAARSRCPPGTTPSAPAVHPRLAAGHGRDLRIKTRTIHCVQLDGDELDLRCVGGAERDALGWATGRGTARQRKAPWPCLTISPPAARPCICSAVEQLVEVSQTRAIADALGTLRRQLGGGAAPRRSLAQLLDGLEAEMDAQVGGAGVGLQRGEIVRRGMCVCVCVWALSAPARRGSRNSSPPATLLQGVDALAGRAKPGNLARPRRFELAAAINRLRTATLRQLEG